jgi:hypothetical protein
VILKKKYKDLNETLRYLKVQVQESIPFACAVIPSWVATPDDLFDWLKGKVKYKSDPKGIELLQTMQTMFRGKYWGVPGRGDCDCFTITTLACAICLGWDDIYIGLVGRSRSHPVHIYTIVHWEGERLVFDLTNKRLGQERSYPFIQEVPVPWQRWKMFQQPVNQTMSEMYLQLAEGGDDSTESNPYIFVPAGLYGMPKSVYIREDYFDYLPNIEFNEMMRQLAPYQPEVQQGMSERGFLHDRASRKARREEKKKLKNEKKAAKNELIKARAVAKTEGRGGDVLKSVVSGLSNIFGKGDSSGTTDVAPPPSPPGGGGGGGDDDDEPTPFYKNPWVIGGAALLTGGIIYAVTRKN